jgi:DNA-directed RNA polymerase subunit M/transcription elongation factor TFIIS
MDCAKLPAKEGTRMKICPDCGKKLSLWQRLEGRCSDCQREADRKQAEAERLVEEQADSRRREEAERAHIAQQQRDAMRKKCPVCGSMRYRLGRLPDAQGSALTGSNRARFRPEENWVEAYPLLALACLSCGHVRLFLFEDDRAYLDQQGASRESIST